MSLTQAAKGSALRDSRDLSGLGSVTRLRHWVTG